MVHSIQGDVRGIDPELHKQARIAALQKGITIGQWYNLALKNQLAKEKGKEKK